MIFYIHQKQWICNCNSFLFHSDFAASPLKWLPSGHITGALTSFKWRIISSFSGVNQTVCSCDYKALINYRKFIFSLDIFLLRGRKKKCDNPSLGSWMSDFPFSKLLFLKKYCLVYFIVLSYSNHFHIATSP